MGTGWGLVTGELVPRCKGAAAITLDSIMAKQECGPSVARSYFFNTDCKWSCYVKLPHSAMLAVNSNLLSNILSGLKKAYLKESIIESISFPMVILRVKADPFHLHPFTLPASGHTANLQLPDIVLWQPKTTLLG